MISYRLFIEGEELVLNEDVQVAITKQFEDVTNPTTVINDWSKTVNIPMCDTNNKIFGHIYDPKKVIVSSSSNQRLTGIYFDPTKKLEFRLEYGSSVVMTGYAKMNSVTKSKGKGTYNITLNGELGKIFQELQKITFNTNDENSDYIINGQQYVDETINKSLVASSWNSNGQTHTGLDGATFTDIIGFAPNNSYYEEFDPKSYQPNANEGKTFVATLETKWDNGSGGWVTGIEPSSVIPDGMLPRDIGEFRSYYQNPYIYWNKLWQIFQKKAEDVTGYRWNLDSSWFNTSNPYWYNLVYMLKPFNVKDGTNLENTYSRWSTWNNGATGSIGKSNSSSSPAVSKICFPYNPESYISEQYPLRYTDYPSSQAVFKVPSDFTSMTYKWTVPLKISTGSQSHISDNNGLVVSIKMYSCDIDDTQPIPYRKPINPRLIQTNSVLIVHEGSSFTYNNLPRYETGTSSSSGSDRYMLTTTYNTSFYASAAKCGAPYLYFNIECFWVNGNSGGLGNEGYLYWGNSSSNGNLKVNLSSGAFRTNAAFTLNDLWNNDYNLFDQILNYCKMYRILVIADHVNKSLKFITSANYFKNYTVSDWTDKVDTSKEFTITPLTFDNKYVIFNYKDNDSKLGEKYSEAWGVNYGEKKIITNYNFNQEEKDLFEKDITSSITSTDFSLSWSNIYDRNTIAYSLPAELFPYAKDDDNKRTDMFGAFFFHNGKRAFDTTTNLHMRSVSLSDDTVFQQSNSTFFYSQGQDQLSVTTYPLLDIISSDGEKLCIFNTPNENYTYAKNYSGTKGIYDMFWKRYLEERYNIQNKLVTCYLLLKPTDFMNFDYNKFITIDGALYMINKIYDYNIASNSSTKVDLITIQDPTAYFVDYYNDYLTVTPDEVTIPSEVGSYSDITVSAFQNAWDMIVIDSQGNEVPLVTSNYEVRKVNNTKVRVTKLADVTLDLYITFSTRTKQKTVRVHSPRSLYVRTYPSSVTIRQNSYDEFEITCETNYYEASILIGNGIQRWRPDTQQWVSTVASLSSYTGGYNKDFEERYFTAKFRGKNISTTGDIQISTAVSMDGMSYLPEPRPVTTVHVVAANQLTLEFTNKNVEYHGATFSISGFSSSDWSWTLPSGVTTYGGSSGEAGNISTTINVSSGSPNTTKYCVLRNDEGMQLTLTIRLVERNISIRDSEGELITDEYVEYHGTSSIRGYKVYATGPWELTLDQPARSLGPTSGTGNVTGGENITVDWGTAYPGTIRSIKVSLTGIEEDVHQTVDCHYVTQENMPT